MGGADSWRFDQGDLDDDVVAIQQAAQARLAQIPPWKPEAAKAIREARAQGGGVYLSVDHSPRARVVEIPRSEEHTSELQSLMRISYAVFCLKKKKDDEDLVLRRRIHDKNTRNPNRTSNEYITASNYN